MWFDSYDWISGGVCSFHNLHVIKQARLIPCLCLWITSTSCVTVIYQYCEWQFNNWVDDAVVLECCDRVRWIHFHTRKQKNQRYLYFMQSCWSQDTDCTQMIPTKLVCSKDCLKMLHRKLSFYHLPLKPDLFISFCFCSVMMAGGGRWVGWWNEVSGWDAASVCIVHMVCS